MRAVVSSSGDVPNPKPETLNIKTLSHTHRESGYVLCGKDEALLQDEPLHVLRARRCGQTTSIRPVIYGPVLVQANLREYAR